ncbi:hypothetical protein FXO38_00839 [Capsicum annuum]|nr:hypothetical protein FXO38_00839 [Capsicum annuum]
MENPDLHLSMGMKHDQKGVCKRKIDPTALESMILMPSNVILSFDGVDIANDGTGRLAHMDSEKQRLVKDIYQLANLGVRLLDSNDKDVIIQELVKSSISVENVMTFENGGDVILRYQGRLCVPEVDGLQERSFTEAHELSWVDHLPLIEFAYNNICHTSIGMAPFEDLYGRRCRSPISWFKVREIRLFYPNLVHQAMEKVKIDVESGHSMDLLGYLWVQRYFCFSCVMIGNFWLFMTQLKVARVELIPQPLTDYKPIFNTCEAKRDVTKEYCEVASHSQVDVVGGLPKGELHEPYLCDTLSIVRLKEDPILVVSKQALVDPIDDKIDFSRTNDLCPSSARTSDLNKVSLPCTKSIHTLVDLCENKTDSETKTESETETLGSSYLTDMPLLSLRGPTSTPNWEGVNTVPRVKPPHLPSSSRYDVFHPPSSNRCDVSTYAGYVVLEHKDRI